MTALLVARRVACYGARMKPTLSTDTPALKPITFIPLNDQVLIRMDIQERTSTIITPDTHGGDTPVVIPSGIVVAVGRGVFVPGTGFVENQCKPGDHVAISTEGSWINLPLSEDKNEVYVTCSESLILGKLENATPAHRWFKKADSDKTLSRLARR